MRDTVCKAICKIKHALRQPGAQEDGRPVVPENWDALFKPQLGSYIKFLLSRPDQFKINEGSGPGFYTVEDVTMGKTVVAPVKGKDKGDKGKGKGKFKGKGKGFDFQGKGKGKDTGEGRDFEALKAQAASKGKGKAKGVTKGKGAQLQESSKASRLLAEAARQALSASGDPATYDDELKEEEMEAAEEAFLEEEAEADEAEVELELEALVKPETEEAEAEAEESADGVGEEMEAEPVGDETAKPTGETEDENAAPKVAARGSYLNLLFSGSLLGTKRPGVAASGENKRAR